MSPCPPSADARSTRILTPNISDYYFNISNAASLYGGLDFNLTLIKQSGTRFYTVPSLLPAKPECGSFDLTLEFCYWFLISHTPQEANAKRVFDFIYATQNQMTFNRKGTIGVMSTPRHEICTSSKNSRRDSIICCDSMAVSRETLGTSSSHWTYGVSATWVGSLRPLAFRYVVTDLEVEQYMWSRRYGRIVRVNGPLPLLRLSISITRPTSPGISESPSQVHPTLPPPSPTSPSQGDKNSSSQNKREDSSNVGLLLGIVVGGMVPLALLIGIICAVLLTLKRHKYKHLRIVARSDRQESRYITIGENMTMEARATQPMSTPEYNHTYVDPKVFTGADYAQYTSLGSEENIYMVPACNEMALHSQLDDFKIRNLPRDSIKLGDSLGSGHFGVVYRGVWTCAKGVLEVAVKTLKEGAGKEDRVKFLQEAAIIGQFKHRNLVTMHGVVLAEEEILLVLELLPKGDLREHLQSARSNDGIETVISLDDHTLLNYCRQVASGMAYLSNKSFVHRDLAARNVLVSADKICKIADFGMSRDLLCDNYYVSHGGMIPVKWTAPEAMHYKKYSTASDVWSYGVLAYEIWSVGQPPFKNVANNKVISAIDSGVRLPPPPGCPRSLYNIMIACWLSFWLDENSRVTVCDAAGWKDPSVGRLHYGKVLGNW